MCYLYILIYLCPGGVRRLVFKKGRSFCLKKKYDFWLYHKLICKFTASYLYNKHLFVCVLKIVWYFRQKKIITGLKRTSPPPPSSALVSQTFFLRILWSTCLKYSRWKRTVFTSKTDRNSAELSSFHLLKRH